MKGYIEACEDSGRVLVIGGMTGRAGNREVESVLGKFGVSRRNENGRKFIELWMGEKIHILERKVSINLHG